MCFDEFSPPFLHRFLLCSQSHPGCQSWSEPSRSSRQNESGRRWFWGAGANSGSGSGRGFRVGGGFGVDGAGFGDSSSDFEAAEVESASGSGYLWPLGWTRGS